MASAIPCDICEQGAADFVVTVVSDGSVVGVHGRCILDFALPVAEAFNAAAAHEAEAEAPSTDGGQPGDTWEDGYPQGRDDDDEGQPAPEGEQGDPEDDEQTASADVPS